MSAHFKLTSPHAKLPTKATVGSAGYDLYSAEDKIIPSRSRALVDTGFSMAFPGSCYARIAPRSGLAVKFCLDVGAGVIDSDYRGPVKVLLINHGDVDYEVKAGDRIAQMIFENIEQPILVEVEDLPSETVTSSERGGYFRNRRGEGGFGSTGK